MNINSRLIHTVLYIENNHGLYGNERRIHNILKSLLYQSQVDVGSDIYLYFLSRAYLHVATLQYTQQKQNKTHYSQYKYYFSYLLAGLDSDAVAGWSMLASFFYVHDNNLTSLDIINYAVSKLTDKNIYL